MVAGPPAHQPDKVNRRTIAIGFALVGIAVLAAVGERALASFTDQLERDLTTFVEEATPDDLEGATYLEPAEVAALFELPTHVQLGLDTVDVIPAANLVLPSGQIAAGDVFLADPTGLDRALRLGSHRVRLLVARFKDRNVVVAAAVVGSPELAVRWLPAFAATSDRPDAEVVTGYAVDSGSAAFASRETAVALADPNGTAEILDGLAETLDRRPYTAIRPTSDGRGAGMVAFPAGYGDGAYPLWWGLDADNRPVALLTDFGVLYNGAPDTGSTS